MMRKKVSMTLGGLIALGIDYLVLALIVGLLVLTQEFGFGVGSAFDILTVFLVLCIVALWVCGGRLHWRSELHSDTQIMPEHADDHATLRH
jgi:hypothetical protein